MLSDNIRNLRKSIKLSQLELAKKCHVTQGAVSQWERGYSRPDTDQLIRLASIFGVSLDKLTEDEKENIQENMIRENSGILEALHKNPKLGLLFDRSRKMDDSQIEAMLSVANAIMKESDGV